MYGITFSAINIIPTHKQVTLCYDSDYQQSFDYSGVRGLLSQWEGVTLSLLAAGLEEGGLRV